MNEAIKTADQKRKEAVLEAKDEAFKLKAEVDAQKQRPTRRSNSAVLRSAVRKTALTRRKMPWIARPKPWSARKRT